MGRKQKQIGDANRGEMTDWPVTFIRDTASELGHRSEGCCQASAERRQEEGWIQGGRVAGKAQPRRKSAAEIPAAAERLLCQPMVRRLQAEKWCFQEEK